jgi:hypothetical protein
MLSMSVTCVPGLPESTVGDLLARRCVVVELGRSAEVYAGAAAAEAPSAMTRSLL